MSTAPQYTGLERLVREVADDMGVAERVSYESGNGDIAASYLGLWRNRLLAALAQSAPRGEPVAPVVVEAKTALQAYELAAKDPK